MERLLLIDFKRQKDLKRIYLDNQGESLIVANAMTLIESYGY